jgi:hypothetical protein
MTSRAGLLRQAAESGWSGSLREGIVERAELICDRSGELAVPVGPYDVGNVAIDLLRAADHDETTLTHALGIGQSRVRREPADDSARRGVRVLEAVIGFLGIKPRADEVGSSGGQR